MQLSLPRLWFYFITLSSTLQTSALIWTEMLLIPAFPLCSSINQIHSISPAIFFQSSLHKGTKNAITSQLFLLVGKVIKRRAHRNFLLRRKAPVISHGSLHKFQKMYQIALRFAKIQKSVIKIRDDDLTKHF